MTATSLDFSQKPDLLPLARVAGALQAVAAPLNIEYFLMGAAARDLLLRHAHNIQPSRLTEDVDFAVMVGDWNAFEALRSALVAGGDFNSRPGPATHRLRHSSGLPLDIVPFGGIERADRTIAWPPDHAEVFDCFGAREAFDVSLTVLLPERVRLQVAPIPALALLKLFDATGIQRVLAILLPEADEDGTLLLAGQSGIDLETARRLDEAFCDELADAM